MIFPGALRHAGQQDFFSADVKPAEVDNKRVGFIQRASCWVLGESSSSLLSRNKQTIKAERENGGIG
jgi:hypothetical protein